MFGTLANGVRVKRVQIGISSALHRLLGTPAALSHSDEWKRGQKPGPQGRKETPPILLGKRLIASGVGTLKSKGASP